MVDRLSDRHLEALTRLEAEGTLRTQRGTDGPGIDGSLGRSLVIVGYARRDFIVNGGGDDHTEITITSEGLRALLDERAWRASPECAALAELDAAVGRAKAKVEAFGYPVRVRQDTVEVTRSCFVRLVNSSTEIPPTPHERFRAQTAGYDE